MQKEGVQEISIGFEIRHIFACKTTCIQLCLFMRYNDLEEKVLFLLYIYSFFACFLQRGFMAVSQSAWFYDLHGVSSNLYQCTSVYLFFKQLTRFNNLSSVCIWSKNKTMFQLVEVGKILNYLRVYFVVIVVLLQSPMWSNSSSGQCSPKCS